LVFLSEKLKKILFKIEVFMKQAALTIRNRKGRIKLVNSMDKEQIKKEYDEFHEYYQQIQNEAYNFLYNIKNDKAYRNIDIADVKQRPQNDIKTLESIFQNSEREDKYNNFNCLLDIKDIAGVRIICHCEDDLLALAEIIENKLNESRYLDVKREDKGGIQGGNKKSRPSYRAIHINFAKKFKHNGGDVKIYCEIQLRTVMGDAWAVQDRRYIYGQHIPEGDRHILTDSVSEIMKGCEGLWSLVKKKYNDGLEIDIEKFEVVKEAVRQKSKILIQEDSSKFNYDIERDNL